MIAESGGAQIVGDRPQQIASIPFLGRFFFRADFLSCGAEAIHRQRDHFA